MAAIKIISSKLNSWYFEEIGSVFGVIRESEKYYLVKEKKSASYYVEKSDCELIS